MPVSELNHYFVRANDLEKTKAFYCDVLGFEVMPRPTFPFPGYWLGVNGKIQVHMGPHGIDNADMYYLGTPKDAVYEKRAAAFLDEMLWFTEAIVDRKKKIENPTG